MLPTLSRADAGRLLRGARRRELALREVYVAYGDRLPGFCFLESGSLVLWLGRGKLRRVFRVISPGESFCEAPALARAPSPFEVRAQQKSVVLAVPVRSIEDLAGRDSTFARALIGLLVRRAMLAIGDLDASTMPVDERLRAYLASIARRAAGGWHGTLPVSKTVLAARLGMKKETLSRALRALADGGLISFRRREFKIRDLKRLRVTS